MPSAKHPVRTGHQCSTFPSSKRRGAAQPVRVFRNTGPRAVPAALSNPSDSKTNSTAEAAAPKSLRSQGFAPACGATHNRRDGGSNPPQPIAEAVRSVCVSASERIAAHPSDSKTDSIGARTDRVSIIGRNTAVVFLSKGYASLIDVAAVDIAAEACWSAKVGSRGEVYAYNRWRGHLHRVIAGTPPGLLTDHHNGDTLDNRRRNLRSCTSVENNANRSLRNRTGFRGVVRLASGRFTAGLNRRDESGKQRWFALGTYDDARAAARAYDAAAIKHFGEFARLNFPIDGGADAPALATGQAGQGFAPTGFLSRVGPHSASPSLSPLTPARGGGA